MEYLLSIDSDEDSVEKDTSKKDVERSSVVAVVAGESKERKSNTDQFMSVVCTPKSTAIADNNVTWKEGGMTSGITNFSSHQPPAMDMAALPSSSTHATDGSTFLKRKRHHRRHKRTRKKKKRRRYSRSPSPSSSSSSSLTSFSNRKDYGSSSRSNRSIKQSTFSNISNISSSITPSTTQGPASIEPRLFMGIPTAVGY